MSRSAALALVLIAAAASCVVGPDYKRPEAVANIPADFNGTTNEWKVAEPQADLPKGRWWELFQDNELNALELSADGANQELKVALAHFDQARALVQIARSEILPTVQIPASLSRTRDSANRPLIGQAAGRSETYNSYTVPLELSYEIDLWGRVRRNIEAAKARLQADAADVEAVRLSLEAEIAIDYFNLRSLDAEALLLKSTIDALGKAVALTRNRRTGGVATDLDVSESETLLQTTEAEIPVVALDRAKLEHALAVLIGEVPSSFHIPERPLDRPPPIIPAGIPSELLERRPDIASAERLMAAANAGIGVSKAAFFPALKLSGLAGFQSLDAGTLFNWPSRFWAIGPSLTMPLFEGGRNRAALRQAEASYRETVAHYRQSVLTAFADVENNLAAQSLLATQDRSQTGALASARRTLEIATNRYKAGLVTYLEVATAQSAALERERATVRLRGQRLAAAVTLVKSLGGGWEKPVSPAQTAIR